MDKTWQSIRIGLNRRWFRGIAAIFSALGAVWLITEITTRVSRDANEWVDHHGGLYLSIAAMVSIIAFVTVIYEPREVTFTIPNTGTSLTLKFSNIFQEAKDWIVGVNEFFDSTLGDIVSATSLHGQIISHIYSGNEERFRFDLDAALAEYEGVTEHRGKGNPVRYPLGTVAVVKNGPHRIYLVALTKTDFDNHRASSSVPILWDALGQAFAKVDSVGNGSPIAMPLIGNGRSSLNIPPQHLLRLIALRIADASKTYDLPRRITINLSDDCFEHLDIVEIKRGWSVI